MNRYDKDRPCPKCGEAATTRYDDRFGRDVLMRKCIRCGYAWSERPLDAAEPPK